MNCKACGKKIVFLRTEKGSVIPVDAETTDAADEYYDKERHTTHFITCPEAARFKKKKGQKHAVHGSNDTNSR